eukprot:1410693-Pleurochrysis_carterae.AAC.2
MSGEIGSALHLLHNASCESRRCGTFAHSRHCGAAAAAAALDDPPRRGLVVAVARAVQPAFSRPQQLTRLENKFH